jgi:hypothetical protein
VLGPAADGVVGDVPDAGALGGTEAGESDDARLDNCVSGARPSAMVFGTTKETLLTVSTKPGFSSQRYPPAADIPPARTLIVTRSTRLRTLMGGTA